MTEQTQALAVGNKPGKLKEYIRSDEIMMRFKEVLGDYQASAYVSSVILAVANSQALQECTPLSIVTASLRAASLRLSCDPSTGQAYLVPFADKGVKKATLIVGYKGLYHMALRTNKYRRINVTEVYQGENVIEDRITGTHNLGGGRTGNKVAGYIGYFQLLSGYQKTVYMTVEEIHAHARDKSRGYNRPDSAWKTDTAMMEKKTVLRLMLSHWGYFDPHDAMAIESLEAENEGVDLLPETVTIEDAPKQTLPEALAGLGYDDEPTPAPMRVVEPPAAVDNVRNSNITPAGNGHEMTIDEAEAIENKNGVKYGTLPTEKLSYMVNAMVKDGNPEHDHKIKAARMIMAARNTGRPVAA